jgi:hypothetical protein
MSPVLRALVDADQRRPGPSEGDRQRVYAALGASLGIVPAGAIVAAHAASASAGTAAATGTATAGTGAVATAVSTASTVGPLALLTKAPLLSVGVGALLGATLTAYVVKGPAARWTAAARARRAAATALVAPRPVVAPAPPAEAPAADKPAAEVELAAKTAAVSPPTRTAPLSRHATAAIAKQVERAEEVRARPDDATATSAASTPAGILAAEQALLDPARAAIARGDGQSALARLALHERRFANGALAQEREAMTIRALVLAGDRDGARRRADTFRTRYPGSLLWPMITATLDAPTGSPH